jgi:hypothetical protein
VRRLLPLLALVALAGCGGSPEAGEATLWVTRDRGAELIVTAPVPSGLTVMQALRRAADVDAGYGGRFVESIEGVKGDAGARRDWFYFVNGIEADRGAAEYRVRPGDVVWWDYRSWSGDAIREPVVVGAFPEPFLHGYDGKVRPAAVRYESESMRGAALGLANAVGARSVEPASVSVPTGANLLLVVSDSAPFSAELRSRDGAAGSPVVFRVSFEDGKRLLGDPELARRRYEDLR